MILVMIELSLSRGSPLWRTRPVHAQTGRAATRLPVSPINRMWNPAEPPVELWNHAPWRDSFAPRL